MVSLMPLLEKGDLKLTMPVYTNPENLASAKPHSVVVFSTIEQEETTVVIEQKDEDTSREEKSSKGENAPTKTPPPSPAKAAGAECA